METLKAIDPTQLTLSAEHLRSLLPYAILTGGSILGMLLAVTRLFNPRLGVSALSLVTLILGGVAAIALMGAPKQVLFGGMMVSDGFSCFFMALFAGAAAMTLLASFRYLDREKLHFPEYDLLVLFATIGMMLMGSSTDLIVIFIALELMSLAIYVLVGFRRYDRRSNEAALKYFILGSAASAILLYGAALLYGSTGSTSILDIIQFVNNHSSPWTPVFALGVFFVVIGFLFKVATVPFHAWMPDVYEGAPSPITGFMTTGVKAAAFACFVRVFISLGLGKDLIKIAEGSFHHLLWAIAAVTMLVGNVVALTQTNLKRMLAYSSIAHTGYLMVGMISAPASEAGFAPVLLYLLVYTIMNLGAFGVLTLLAGPGDSGLQLNDLAGLSTRRPWLAFALGVFLFSMAGIPPTAGFAAKYYLLYSAVQAGELPLVVISVLCSAVSVYYYLRVLVFMYMREPTGSTSSPKLSWAGAFAVSLMVVLTLQIGVLPSQLLDIAKRVVTGL